MMVAVLESVKYVQFMWRDIVTCSNISGQPITDRVVIVTVHPLAKVIPTYMEICSDIFKYVRGQPRHSHQWAAEAFTSVGSLDM